MKEICTDKNLIAYCGLYCGACKKYLQEKCPGCLENNRASWCKVRTCCIEHSYSSCADCQSFENLKECKKLNNFIARLFSFFFGSDRFACIASIKEKGYESYAQEMAEKHIMTMKK